MLKQLLTQSTNSRVRQMIHTHPKTTCNRLQVLDVLYSEAISIQTLLERLVLVLFIAGLVH